MLKNENIICISWLVWDSIPLVMHQMMTRLAENNRVLFVDPPVAYSNLVIRPDWWKRYLKNTWLWFRGIRQIRENFYVYSHPPLLIQYGHSNIIDKGNHAYATLAIKRAAAKLGFDSPVLWIYHPYVVMPQGQFNEKVVCYDCNDDVGFFFSHHFDKRKKLSAIEEELTKRADVVFATSRHLFHLRKKQNPNTHYLPSAVDIELFKRANSSDVKIASELESIPKPIIGFIGGMVNTKMNWEWIRAAAVSQPQWNFVFVGPCGESPPQYILEQKNIVFLGAKPQEALPAYLKGFDVCLIPYQGESFLKACQPTKTFEYLAAGKPVVSSWIPELEDYRDVVLLSRETEEFIQNIKLALTHGKNPSMIQRYKETARGWTWEERVGKASQLIESLLKTKNT
ncbi:MAG: glycosyltransferase family 1 protein [wastewater metagenome]|nr:glycosyltransferase family 1 protein [Candidatus Loosdrechtia aerotolerans]